MTTSQLLPIAVVLSALAHSASADTGTLVLNFDELVDGAILAEQYAPQGISFRANAFNGGGSSSSGANWSTNTDLTILDIGALTADVDMAPGPFASGKVLRSVEAWFDEDGDPSFEMRFAQPVRGIAASFVDVSTSGGQAADTRLFVYRGDSLLGVVAGQAVGSPSAFTLSYVATGITRVVFAPGSFDDWVAVDNIVVTSAVPEPQTWALMLAGMAGITRLLRRRGQGQDLQRNT